MNYIEIKMEVKDRDAVEALSNMLAEMGTGGVMIEDPQAIADYANSGLWDAHEFTDELMQRKDIIIKSYHFNYRELNALTEYPALLMLFFFK